MIAIVNYGLGNLGSIKNMLMRLGVQSVITDDISVLRTAQKMILPGVGAFDVAMDNLKKLGFIDLLNEQVLVKKTPILGICLGMQIMSKRSEEGVLPGLGWVDAETVRFKFNSSEEKLKIPHMGWSEIEIKRENALLKNFDGPPRFYFVHSYHVRCHNSADVLATAQHGIPFTASLNRENIWGAQFHPEKSHKFGMQVLKNFADI